MTILSGISLHSLLDMLSALATSAVSGQGIVLFLQAVAYVLVSLAAIAILLRLGLRGGHSRNGNGGCHCHSYGGCDCHGGDVRDGDGHGGDRRDDEAAAPIPPAHPATAAPITPAYSAPVAPIGGESEADEQHRMTAVIAAAVHNVLGGRRHRIVRIQPINHSWAQEGRRDIFSSHRIR